MRRDAGRRRIYRARAVRRRRSALAIFVAVALALIVIVTAQGGGRERARVTYDRRAAVAYADAWALKVNPEYWSSPDNDCANFVSQCLAAGGLRPTYDAGREWRSNGTEFPTVAWVNCGAQKRALSARAAGRSRYIARTTRTLPPGWAAGDIVYLGNVVDGERSSGSTWSSAPADGAVSGSTTATPPRTGTRRSTAGTRRTSRRCGSAAIADVVTYAE